MRILVMANLSPMNSWNTLVRWFNSAPTADPCNARVMQLLMLAYGVLLPASWGWRIVSHGGLDGNSTIALIVDLLLSLLALYGFVLIRRGRFQTAVTLFLVALLCALEIAFLTHGAQFRIVDAETPMILSLVLSGVMLGRRALWLTFGSLMVIFASGLAIHINTGATSAPIRHVLRDLPSIAVAFLLITFVLDRYIRTVRGKLAESITHEHALRREMEARERAQARLVHAQKMEATGRLASGIAHDFNNILDVIMGYAVQRNHILQMENRLAQDAEIAKVMAAIEAAAMRGREITRKLLAFNRHELVRSQVFDAGQAIAEMQPMLRQLLPRSIYLELPEATEPAYIRFDRSEFELMILNIAANARDAMPQDGRFRIHLKIDAGFACIALSDTGYGMDAELQQRIFEPFFSTKAEMGGTGLGLAVIQDMVLAAGGDILVDSAAGQGSTFVVRIPRLEALAPA